MDSHPFDVRPIVDAIEAGWFGAADQSILLHDLGLLDEHVAELHQHFPQGTLHAVAIKANPVIRILERVVASGAGLEAASMEEVHLARAAGCDPAALVFDSPAKTVEELIEALDLGVVVNANSFEELRRIDAVIDERTTSRVGLRVNPEVGNGRIGTTSVASGESKFGVTGSDSEAVMSAFARYPWLTGLHCHVGSQGCDLELLVGAARRVRDLTMQVRERFGDDRLQFIDLGGGLPVAYADNDHPPTIATYAKALGAAVPELFDGSVQLITEFGRTVHAACGLAVSRIEYVNALSGGRQQVVIHLGADFLLRPVYRPEDWSHRFVALDSTGSARTNALLTTEIVGPLCFGGDVVARNVELPAASPGDLIAIRDIGAYTLSMWSRHCSRGIPKVVGHDSKGFSLLRRPENPADVVQFWRD